MAKGGGKISSVKRNNKNVTKLNKQGKMNKLKRGGKKHEDKRVKRERESEKAHFSAVKRKGEETKEVEKEEPEENDDEDSLDAEINRKDLKYFEKTEHLSFLSSNLNSNREKNESRRPAGKKRKRDDEEEDEVHGYEMAPRTFNEAITNENRKKRLLLPLKDKTKLIQRVGERVVVAEEEEDDEEMEEITETETPQGFDDDDEGFESGTAVIQEIDPTPMTPLEAMIWRQKKIAEKKQRMALLCTSIMERPEERMGKLKELRMMLSESDPRLRVTVKKFAALSMLEIFKDVIPSYRIRALTEVEKAQRMKKETLALVDFEEGLLKNYRLYLVELEKMIKGLVKSRSKKTNDTDDDIVEKTSLRNLGLLALRCVCELLLTHPHFNYRTNIITVVVPLMGSPDSEVRSHVCQTIEKVFKGDYLGDVSYEIVKTMGTELKARQHAWPRHTLDACLSLRIRNDLSQKQDEKSEERKKRYEAYKKLMKYASRKEKKRKKKMAELENQLKATEATENPDANLEWNTKTITQLFAIYFRILKKGRNTALLGSTLAGLSHFAHLINLDFFDDLLANLHSIITTHEGLTFENTLHCVHTTFTILSGQGSALNIDPMRFYGKLYKDLVAETTVLLRKDADLTTPVLLKCVFKMIIARSKQVSMSRLLAFTKRLATLALHQDHASTIAMIAIVRKLLLCSPKTEILYDNEGTGSGVYLPEMEDPEYCKPEATALWELHKLRRHYHPVASNVAAKVLRHHPLKAEHKLSPEFALKDPAELLALFAPNPESDFRPSLVPLPRSRLQAAFRKKKGKMAIFRVHRFADAEFGAQMGTVLDTVADDIELVENVVRNKMEID